MTADRLREAALVLREMVEAATPGPWERGEEIDGVLAGQLTTVKGREVGRSGVSLRRRVVTVDTTREHWVRRAEANVAYIATMHPGVGLALADWLDALADHNPHPLIAGEREAFILADLILGSAS